MRRIPKRWLTLFAHLPGYDPVATAEHGDWFDARAADSAVAFFPKYLQHVEGKMAGKPYILEAHEQAFIGCLFGWKREDGTRRYRTAFYFIPRKNSKSTLCAGIVIYVGLCDGERGAQLYSTAAEHQQASLVFSIASRMIDADPDLSSKCEIRKSLKSIEFTKSGGFYRALSADAPTKHGFNTHLSINDELHAMPSSDLIDVIETSMGARRQPLSINITTSDYDRPGSVCNAKYEQACKVRDGVIRDHAFLPVIFEATRDEAEAMTRDADGATKPGWQCEALWRKANPMYGKSIEPDYLRRACQEAIDFPAKENTFKRLHLNIRTTQDVVWIPLDRWDASSGLQADEAPANWRDRLAGELAGRPCFAGLDLSRTTDLTAGVLIFPPEEGYDPAETDNAFGVWTILAHFWMPADCLADRGRRDGASYSLWARQGFVTPTPGNEIDQPYIRRKINEWKDRYNLVEIGYDPVYATELSRQLREEDGIEMTIVRQGAMSLGDPMQRVEGMVASRRLHHGGNPVMRYCMANVKAKVDQNGNMRPDKATSTGRIDGVSALVTGMARALAVGVPAKSDWFGAVLS